MTIDFAHADGDLDMYVAEYGGDVIAHATSFTDGEELVIRAPARGYRGLDFVVYGHDGATNSYRLTVRSEIPYRP